MNGPRGLVLDFAGVLTEPEAGELLALLDKLRDRGIKTALLSNAAGGGSVRRRLEPFFDAQVYSGEVGCAKPAREVFLLTASLLDLPADACVFVDDAASNVAGAVAAGMAGVHHTSIPETLGELEILFSSAL
ncbi:HAD family hydrolase [Amycolatopsis sp. CA-230715]|uniref:HAD family hydrolase n=1 Tax=Amycolatopsis sp. CA-230715 TaxID=2745196 RepID=UPI001C00F3E7|nr:HAD-IA family hydrolase [Amycolatopsis sp. CA-230715]